MTIKKISTISYGGIKTPMDTLTIAVLGCVPVKFDGRTAELEMTKDQAYLIWQDLNEIFVEGPLV